MTTIHKRSTGLVLAMVLALFSALSLCAVAIAEMNCLQDGHPTKMIAIERVSGEGTADDNSLGCHGGGTCRGFSWEPAGPNTVTGECAAVGRTQ